MANDWLEKAKDQDFVMIAMPSKSYIRLREIAEKRGLTVADLVASSIQKCCDEEADNFRGPKLLTEQKPV
jgi:LDH2 family malate/lactate/ureidoglycolate dehydrogenase